MTKVKGLFISGSQSGEGIRFKQNSIQAFNKYYTGDVRKYWNKDQVYCQMSIPSYKHNDDVNGINGFYVN
jgi:hypothetical protein